MRTMLSTLMSTTKWMQELKSCGELSDSKVLYVPSRPAARRLDAFDSRELDEVIMHERYLRSRTGQLDLDALKCEAERWAYAFDKILVGESLVMWNGRHLPLAVASHVAKMKEMKVVLIDSGIVPGTLLIDGNGVLDKAGIASHEHFPDADADVVGKIRSLVLPERTKTSYREPQDSPLPDRYALFIAQVRGDTQISTASGGWNSVSYAACAFNLACAQAGIQMVVRLHPNDLECGNEISACIPGVPIVWNSPLEDCIRNAAFVGTINSSAGLQARMMDKRTAVMGKASYHFCCYECQNYDSLRQFVEVADEWSERVPDRTNVDKFLSELSRHLLAVGDVSLNERWTRYAKRIREIEDGVVDTKNTLTTSTPPAMFDGGVWPVA